MRSLTAYTLDADGLGPSGIVNFSRTVRWVDITVLMKIFLSPDDIARPRGKVFDDDHPLAYVGRGVFVGIGLIAPWVPHRFGGTRMRERSGVLRINQGGVPKAACAGNSCESPVRYPLRLPEKQVLRRV